MGWEAHTDPPRSVARCRARPSASVSTSGADATTSAVAPNRASAAAVARPSAATTTRPVKSRRVPSANARDNDVALDGEQNDTAWTWPADDGGHETVERFDRHLDGTVRDGRRHARAGRLCHRRPFLTGDIGSRPDQPRAGQPRRRGGHRLQQLRTAPRGDRRWRQRLPCARAPAVTGPTAATLMRPDTCGQRRRHAWRPHIGGHGARTREDEPVSLRQRLDRGVKIAVSGGSAVATVGTLHVRKPWRSSARASEAPASASRVTTTSGPEPLMTPARPAPAPPALAAPARGWHRAPPARKPAATACAKRRGRRMVGHRRLDHAAHGVVPVQIDDQSLQAHDTGAREGRQCADRGLAAALEFGKQRSLRRGGQARVAVVEQRDQCTGALVVCTYLDGQRTLTRRRQHHVGAEHLGDVGGQAETGQSGHAPARRRRDRRPGPCRRGWARCRAGRARRDPGAARAAAPVAATTTCPRARQPEACRC